jgi:hypothetical protein
MMVGSLVRKLAPREWVLGRYSSREGDGVASPIERYQREIHGSLGFFPTWLPGRAFPPFTRGFFVEVRSDKES